MTYDELKAELLTRLTELDVKIAALRALVDGWHPPLAPSPAWTEMPPAARIIMANGDVVTVVNGSLQINDAAMGSTSKVTLTYIDDKNAIRHTSTDTPGYWWLWNGTGWGATPDTRPGTTPPPTTDTKIKQRILSWLHTLPRNKVMAAQMTHSDNGRLREIEEFKRLLGTEPASIGVDPWMDDSPINPNTSFIAPCVDFWKRGGMVQMSMFTPNPAGGDCHGAGNAVEILKLGSAQNKALYQRLDQAAVPLRAFRDAGMAVPFRPYLEMDGNWFWWSRAYFNAVQFNELWRLTHRYLTTDLGLDNLIWIFAANGGPLAYNFVGEDVVDWIGIDGYTDYPDSQGYTNLYNRQRQEAPNLLCGWAEFGSGGPSACNPNYDMRKIVNLVASGAQREMAVIHAWTGWGWYQCQYAKEALANSYVLTLPNLGRPKALV